MTAATPRPLTPRRATWLILRPPDQCAADGDRLLARLTAQFPALAEAVALAHGFACLIRLRQPAQLEPWLIRAAQSALTPFRRFAKGLRADMAAVQAAVTLPWKQGPIESQINRLKMLKRQMFSRARRDAWDICHHAASGGSKMSLPSREPWLSIGEAQHRLADSSRDSTAESVPMSDGSTTVPGSNALGGGAP